MLSRLYGTCMYMYMYIDVAGSMYLEKKVEQYGGKGRGGGGVGKKGVGNDLEGIVGLNALNKVVYQLSEDLLEHGHAHHGELGEWEGERE